MVAYSGTAALQSAMAAIGIAPGDEVLVPAIFFVFTANCVVYCKRACHPAIAGGRRQYRRRKIAPYTHHSSI